MSNLKTKEEIRIMAKAGKISALAMKEVAENIRPGISTLELDQIVDKVFKKLGAEAAFKKVENYQYTICTTPNDWIVHGIPGNHILKEGDIIGVDLGALVDGYNSDMAQTFVVGKADPSVQRFLEAGELALKEAIKQAKVGNRVGDISNTIQTMVESAGYSVVKELVGHGVGKVLHEDPMIPGRGEKGKGEELKEGLVIAIEVIYNKGSSGIVLLDDGWTIATKDGNLAGLFERTVVVTKKGPVVLTAE